MEQKIQVLVDIYPNRFSTTKQWAYANIRAINPNEQPLVDNCLQQMQETQEESEFLLDNMIVYGNSPLFPTERNRKCFLNISQQKFEF